MRALRTCVLSASLVLVACGGEPARPDVVMFLVDTLRADHVGAYGYPREVTPRLDALAAEGVLFERAYAPAPWTLPSIVSIMTSTFPCEHGVVVDGQRLSPALVPFAERLRARGYATANFHANAYAGALSGLDRGFDVSEARDFTDGERVGRWLDNVGADRPVFLYVHNIEPHTPYQSGTEEASRFEPVSVLDEERVNASLGTFQALGRVDWSKGRAPGTTDVLAGQDALRAELAALRDEVIAFYDADIRQADSRLGSVLDALRVRDRLDDAIVVVLSDHGEEFGEHAYWQHDQSLYEELVRVPLVFRLPGGRAGGRRIAGPVSLVDVVPTLAVLLEDPALAAGTRGRSLVPAIDGTAAEASDAARVVAQRVNRKKFYAPHARERGDRNVAIVSGRWKAVWNQDPGSVELYDLQADALESVDRSADEKTRSAELSSAAQAWSAACRLEAPTLRSETDPATLERLRALGYAE